MTHFFHDLCTFPIWHISASPLGDFNLVWLANFLWFLAAFFSRLLVAFLFSLVLAYLMWNHNIWSSNCGALDLGNGHAHFYRLVAAPFLLLVAGYLPVHANLFRHSLLNRLLYFLALHAGHRVTPVRVHGVTFTLQGGNTVVPLHLLADHTGDSVALLLSEGHALLLLARLTFGRGHVLALHARGLRAVHFPVLVVDAHLLCLVATLPPGGCDAILGGGGVALLPRHLAAHFLQHLVALAALDRAALLTCHVMALLLRNLCAHLLLYLGALSVLHIFNYSALLSA